MPNEIQVRLPDGFPAVAHTSGRGSKWGDNVPQTTVDFFKDGVRVPPVRSTPLAVLDECPRKFLYAFKLGIASKVTERPLTVGTFTHLVLKHLFLGSTEAEALSKVEAALTQADYSLIAAADEGGFLPGGADLKSALENMQDDYHKARAMAICFWRFRPFDTAEWDVLRTPTGEPMVERVLTCEVPGIETPLRTPCDLALVNKKSGEVWIVDFKTTSFDPKLRSIPTRISPQLALYRLVLQAHLDSWHKDSWSSDYPAGCRIPQQTVVGSIHAIIKKPTIKYCPDTKDKAGFHAYIERLIQWYKDAEAKDPSNPPLVLDPNRFSGPAMTSELWHRLVRYSGLATSVPNFDTFYRAGDSACLKYNKPCPFLVLCNSAPAMIPDLVRTNFTIEFREDKEETE
jgi:hypothetical protein